MELPPHNLDAERSVIGAILRDPDVYPVVRELISTDAFYLDAHQRVIRAIDDLSTAGRPVDLVSVVGRLTDQRHLDDVGGRAFLVDLYTDTPTGANAEYHAKLIRDAATRRNLIHAANEILRDAYHPTGPADELVATAERRLFDLRNDSRRAGEAVSAKEMMVGALTRLDERLARGGGLDGIATGYPDLDERLGGLRPGMLVILGARPGGGKTALSLNIATQVTAAGIPTLMFSMEMPTEEVADRLLSMGSGIPASKIGRGKLSPEDIDRLTAPDGDGGARKLPLWVDDTPALSGDVMLARTRRAVRKLGIRFLVVDYLQLMRPENPRENRTQQVGLMARRVWGIARECNLPVLCLCQLNRQLEGRTDQRPKLSDLRESGEIEQHAHKVILLSPENPDPMREVWTIVADVAKNRNGPVGEVRLAYRRPVLRFENYFPI